MAYITFRDWGLVRTGGSDRMNAYKNKLMEIPKQNWQLQPIGLGTIA